MKRNIALTAFFCLSLAACNNTAQIQAGLKKAGSQCVSIARLAYPEGATDADIRRGVYAPKPVELEKGIDCITEHERPVWAKYAPAFLDLYDAFRAKIASGAEAYAKGDISYKEYMAEGLQEVADFNNDVRARRASIDADNQQTSAAIGSIGNSLSQVIWPGR